MKTLLFNGCSFVAGDDLVWDQFRRQYQISDSITSTDLMIGGQWNELYDQYTQYRRSYNLPRKVSEALGIDTVDLSRGGQSNDSIAWRTLEFLNKVLPENRRDYHVVVGWTALARSMKYWPRADQFVDLVLTESQIDSEGDHPIAKYRDMDQWCDALIKYQTDQDLNLDFLKNVMLLEQYCRSHGISYTFFRSMGTIGDLDHINSQGLTDTQRWLKFPNQKQWLTSIWQQQLEISQWISPKNSHPNSFAVAKFTDILAPKIRRDLVLTPGRI